MTRPRSTSCSVGRVAHGTVALVALVLATVSSPAAAAECWQAPVNAPVSDPYREPPCRWCRGNRGVEYATEPGAPVRAVRSGVVTFAGAVAGTRYVVVRHPNGWRATYGHLSEVNVGRGDTVVARARLGSSTERVHFGLRDGARYVDPTPFLGRSVYPVRLVPHDGSAAPPVEAAFRCGR